MNAMTLNVHALVRRIADEHPEIAESVVKAGGPWREIYDRRKVATEGRVHVVPCVRCGPSGKPAQPGSEWSKGHRHADALRVLSKEILKGLWTESKRLYSAAEQD